MLLNVSLFDVCQICLTWISATSTALAVVNPLLEKIFGVLLEKVFGVLLKEVFRGSWT